MTPTLSSPQQPTVQQPTVNADGTLTAVLEMPARLLYGALWLTLALPRRTQTEQMGAEQAAGRFVLARCGAQSEAERAEQWSIYLRRALYVAAPPQLRGGGESEIWRFTLPAPAAAGDGNRSEGDPSDPGVRWLAERQAGETINLSGPFGSGFVLASLTRRLLLIADPPRLGLVYPLIDEALDRGGQVSLLLLGEAAAPAAETLRAALPLAVELHRPAGKEWAVEFDDSLRWADQVCVALAAQELPALAAAVRRTHIRFEPGFAFALVESDLACGYGACLACVVPLANGSLTRACVHGPVFDLLELAGRG